MKIKAEFLKEKEWSIIMNEEYKITILYNNDDSYTLAIIPKDTNLLNNTTLYNNITCHFNDLVHLFDEISNLMDHIKEVHQTNNNGKPN